MMHLMKKGFKNAVYALLCFTTLFIFSNCEVGLGEAIDVNAPTVSVTYPPASSVIRDTFILAGSCEDDTKVSSIEIKIKNTDENKSYGTFYGNVSGTSWTASLNKKQPDGTFEFPDGRYVADVIAIDGSGKKSGITSLPFDVDNMAPLFILSSPSSNKKDHPTAYGSCFKVSGIIADDHTVSEMNVKLYDKDADAEVDSPLNGDGWVEKNIDTAGGTEIVFANRKGSEELQNRYNTIYAPLTSGDKEFLCKIITSDTAKLYVNPNEAVNETKGNTTETFYLYDDVYDDWLSAQSNLDASKVKRIINGTNSDSSISESKKEEIKQQAVDKKNTITYFTINPDANPKYQVLGFGSDDITSISGKASGGQLVTVNICAGRNGTKVKPETLAVYQFGPYSDTLTASDIAKIYGDIPTFTAFYNSEKGNNKAVTLAFNGDRSVSVPSYPTNEIEDNKCGKYESGSVESYNYSINLTQSLEAGQYYYIAVIGSDIEGSVADPLSTMYAFQGYTTMSPPTVHWPSEKESSEKGMTFSNDAADQGVIVNKGNLITDGEGVKATGPMHFEGYVENKDGLDRINKLELTVSKKEVNGKEAPESIAIDVTNKLDKTTGKFAFDLVEVSSAGKVFNYDVDLVATNTSNLSDTKNRKFYVDTQLPDIEINDVSPYVTAENNDVYLNGTFKVSGSVEDNYLDDVWYEIVSNDGTDPVTAVSKDDAVLGDDGHGMWYSFLNKIVIDSTDVSKFKTYNDTVVDIRVHAKDKAGNESVRTVTEYINDPAVKNGPVTDYKCWIKQSSDVPVISNSNFYKVTQKNKLMKTSEGEDSGNLYDGTVRSTINGTVTDDDGISKIKVDIKNEAGTSLTGYPKNLSVKYGSTNQQFSIPLPEEGGFYKASITAIDKTYDEFKGIDDTKNAQVNQNRTSTFGEYWFAIDKEVPTLTEEAIGTAAQFANSSKHIVYKGAISDDLLLPQNPLKVKITNSNDYSDEQNITVDYSTGTADRSGKWSYDYQLPSSASDGTYTLTFTATDSYERAAAVTRTVTVDTTPPAITIRSVVPEVTVGTDKYLNGKVKVTGTIVETHLADVWYQVKVDGTAVTGLPGASTEAGHETEVHLGDIFAITDEIEIDTTKYTNGKPIEIIISAIDTAENVASVSTTEYNGGTPYEIDQNTDRPVIEPSNFNNVTDKTKLCRTPEEGSTDSGNLFDGSSASKLMGSFSDDDGIDTAVIYLYKEDGTTKYTTGSNRADGGYDLSIKQGATTTAFAFDKLPTEDGIYQAEIIVRDVTYNDAANDTIRSYREKKLGKFYFGIDAKPPVITLNGDETEQIYANNTKLISFSGTVSDKLKLETHPKTLKLEIKTGGEVKKIVNFEAGSGKQIAWDSGKDWLSGSFAYSFKFADLGTLADGTYECVFTAEDIYGRTTSVSRNVIKDTKLPVMDITSVTPYVQKTVDVNGTPTEKMFLNGTFKVSGTVDEVNLDEVWFEVKCDGNTVDSSTMNPAQKGKWYSFSEEITIDSTNTALWKTTDKKPVEVVVHAKDKAGNEGTISTTTFNSDVAFEIDQSTDKPVVSGNNFCLVTDEADLTSSTDFENNKGNIFDKTSNNKLIGKVEDDDGVASITVLVFNKDESIQISSTPVTGFTTGTTTAAFTFTNMPSTSGIYKVKIVARDITYSDSLPAAVKANRETTYGPFLIAVDSENPDLEETKINTSDIQYVSNELGTIEFEGTVSDDWEIAAGDGLVVTATYTDSAAGSTPVTREDLKANITVSNPAGVSNWTHSVSLKNTAAKTYGPGLYIFTFTAKDKGGKTTSIVRKVYKDTILPLFGTGTSDTEAPEYDALNVKPYITTVKNNGWYNTTTLNIAGTVSDVGSGVKKVEYTLNAAVASPTWTELAGTSTFGGTVAGVEDGKIITLRVTDVAGNINSTVIEGIRIDTGVPSAVVTEIDGQTEGIGNILTNGQNDIVVSGTASDALSGISSIKITAGDKLFTSPDVTITSFTQAKDEDGEDIPGTFTWTGTIPHLKDGNPYLRSGTVWGQVTDGAGNTSDVNLFSLQVDNVDPEVHFADSIIDATVNKKITISGTGSDDQKLASIKLEYKVGTGDWGEIPVTGTYNWKVEDLDTETAFGTIANGTTVKLRATAIDAAGNTKSEECNITVDQDTDRPVITFTNLGDLTGMSSSNYIFFGNVTMMGNIEDDDGNVKDLKIIIKKVTDESSDPDYPTDAEWDSSAAINVALSNGSFKCDKLVQGKQAVYFRVVDKKDEVFVSKASKDNAAVYLKDDANTFGDATHGDSALYLKVDTVDPSLYDGLKYNLKLNSDGIYELIPSSDTATAWADSIETVTFGGIRPSFKLRVFARDDNGIKSVVATIGDSSETQGYRIYDGEETSSGSGVYKEGHGPKFTKKDGTETINVKGVDTVYEIWESPDILTGGNADNGNLKDGIINLRLEVFDNGGRSSTKTIQLSIDNTPPAVNVTSPKSTITVSGETNAYGDISEASKLYYAISTSGTVSPDSDAAITTWYENGNSTPKTIANIADKVNYSEMLTAGKIWYLYFDNDADPSQLYTHTGKTLNEYIIDYGITTAADLNKGAESFSDIVELYLWIKAVDETAGNVSEKCHKILLDPQGDRPIVDITYPVKDTSNPDIVIGGGHIKVYGGAEARNAKTISSVWVQLVPKSIHSGTVKYPSDSGIISYRGTTKAHNNDWSANIAYETLSDGYKFTKFTVTTEDLDYLADAGYNVYNMNTFTDADLTNDAKKWTHGKTLAAGEKASDYAALVNLTGTTWNITVNQSGEFNPVKNDDNPSLDDTNKVAMRVIARDSSVKFSIPSDIIFEVDNGTPYYGAYQNIYLVQSGETGIADYDETWTASREYTEDMFVRGEWYIIGSVEDDKAIKNLSVFNRKTNTTDKLVVNYAAQASTSTFDVKEIGVEGHNGYYFKYKLNTSGEVGEVDLEFNADDDAEHTGKKDIKFKFDNLRPQLETEVSKGYNLRPSVNNTDNFYKLSSAVKEENKNGNKQSGFDYVAFYFMRRINGNVIYDVMESRYQDGDTSANTANKITIPSNLSSNDWKFEDGIYWKKLTVERDSVLLGKLILAAKDENIHAGGLVKVGGTNYLINSVSADGKEITIAGNPPETYTEAYFARGVMVCNNTVTESSGGTMQSSDHGYGYGYYSKPANDDGDRMIESVSNEGTTWKWEASINSKNIPDGPIELHYIAFDKAGNYSVGIMSNVDKTTFSAYTTPDADLTSDELDAIAYSYSATSKAFVSNNRPRIAGVVFGTDNDGDGEVTEEVYDADAKKWIDNEMITDFAGWYMADSESDFYDHDYDFAHRVKGVEHNGKYANGDDVFEFNVPKELSDAPWTIKGRTVVKPEVVGGNNGIKYTYEVRSSNDMTAAAEFVSATKDFVTVEDESHNVISETENDSVTEHIRKNVKIDLSLKELIDSNISDGQNKMFTFKIWDKTEGTTAGTDSQYATVNIMADVLLHDAVPPTACITPFYWRKNANTGALENSLYQNLKDNGHIELEDDWKKSSVYSSSTTSGIYDGDPKVSGTIVIRGKAVDNVRVNKIDIKIPGFNSGAWTTVAQRVGTTWQTQKTLAANGIELVPYDSSDECAAKLVKEEFTREANTVYFAIAWNTAKITGVAASDVAVEVRAYDAGQMTGWDTTNNVPTVTANSASSASSTQTTKESETPYYKMDVVPYISSIETKDRNNSGLKKNNVRSASGKYSVIMGSVDNFITAYGFNLNPTDARIVNNSTVKTSITASSGIGLTVGTVNVDGEAGDYQSCGIKNDGTRSGYLELFVNGIRTLNNVNDNDVSGEYEAKKDTNDKILVTEYEYLYNREADYNNTKNVKLTDDRYIKFFDMRSTGIVNGYYPTMIMNDDNPVFGYVDKNGGTSGTCTATGEDTYAGSYNPSHAMPQRSEFSGTDLNGSGNAKKVYTEYLIKASTWDQMGMAVDEGGRYYNVSVYNRDGCAMSLIYDRYNEIYNSSRGYGWGAGTGYQNYAGDWSDNEDNNAITLENVNYDNVLGTERYQFPKLIAKGNSLNGTASIYMAYYDTVKGEICFRNFMLGTVNATPYDVYTVSNNTSIAFTYSSSITVYQGQRNNRTSSTVNNVFKITNTTNDYTNYYVLINDNYYKLQRISYYASNSTNTISYYYTLDDAIRSDFTSKIYSHSISNTYSMSGNDASAVYALSSSDRSDINGNPYEQYVNFKENTSNSNTYGTGRITAVSSGSKYFDIKVTKDKYVIIVYYDESNSRLVMRYSKNPVTGSNPTAEIEWVTSDIIFPEYVGNYVSMALDEYDGIHIAAFDSGDSDLAYIYVPSYSTKKADKKMIHYTVDQSGAVGNWTQIKINSEGKPVIAYTNATENGQRDAIKLAIAEGKVVASGTASTIGTIKDGIDSKTKYTTGEWEYMTVPAITPPQGGDSKFQNVCLDFDSDGRPVVGYLGTSLEFGKALDE